MGMGWNILFNRLINTQFNMLACQCNWHELKIKLQIKSIKQVEHCTLNFNVPNKFISYSYRSQWMGQVSNLCFVLSSLLGYCACMWASWCSYGIVLPIAFTRNVLAYTMCVLTIWVSNIIVTFTSLIRYTYPLHAVLHHKYLIKSA